MDEALFKCTHDALVFAFNYQSQQSPASAMLRAMVGPTGTGKGLSGNDGAAQAGFIRAAVDRLNRQCRDAIIARYAGNQVECPCCHQTTASEDWHQAVNNLSLTAEIRDLPRPVRLAVVQLAMKLRKGSVGDLSRQHGLNERTLYHKIKKMTEMLCKVERTALIQLDGLFYASGLTFGNEVSAKPKRVAETSS